MGKSKQFLGTDDLKDSRVTVASDARILQGADMIEALLQVADIAAAKEAADAIRGLTPERGGLLDIPGSTLGGGSGGRRIGGVPGGKAGKTDDGTGFDDPLAGHRNTRPGGTVVGPPGMPSKDGLTRNEGDDPFTGYGTDGGTRSTDGSSSTHGYVWRERSTERTSRDGMRTWGSVGYRDYAGNHWRVDYTETRTVDGNGLTSKETVFDSTNKPVSTTLREMLPDGTARATTTNHKTDEVTTETGTLEEIFPARYQPDEGGGGGGDSVAPRGWSNPISGAVQNPGLAVGNNQVNPGREPKPTPAEPLQLDPRILVVNPAPDAVLPGSGQPTDIRAGNPTIVDPPRPTL
jgi:hypothetical protein